MATPTADARPLRPRLPALGPLWAWFLPVLVMALVRYEPGHLVLGVGVLVALALVFLVARRAELALLTLVALLPFEEMLLAALFRLGVPTGIVRNLGFWNEVVVAGCAVAAVRNHKNHRRLDAIDVLAVLYLGIVGLYFLFPRGLVSPIGPSGIGPPTGFTILATAARNDTVFVVLLLVARRSPLSVDFRRRFVATSFSVGGVVAAVGVFEFVFSNAWNHLIVSTIRVPRYLKAVLNVSVGNPKDIRVYSVVNGHIVLRIGSVFFDQLSCGLYLVIALGIGLERLVRGDRRMLVLATTGVIGVAILLTQTRAAIIAAVIVIACTMRPSVDRSSTIRARYVLLVVAGVLTIAPLALVTHVAARSLGAVTGEPSAILHVQRTEGAAKDLLSQPLGRGLGTGGANGSRFGVTSVLVSEDHYLLVGNETGAISMVVFVALVFVLNRRLLRLVRRHTDILTASCGGVFLGLSVGALFLEVWLALPLAWTVWIGMGACLSAPRQPAGSAVGPAPSDTRSHPWALARRVPLVLVTMAAALLAAHHPAPRVRRYTAETTVVIGVPQFLGPPAAARQYDNLTMGLLRQRLVYTVAVTTGPIPAEAVYRAGVARSPGTVASETTVRDPPGTQLLTIGVTDSDPTVAAALANGLATSLIVDAPSLLQLLPQNGGAPSFALAIVAPAAPPAAPDPSPGTTPELAHAALFALSCAIGLVAVVEYLDRDAARERRRLDVLTAGKPVRESSAEQQNFWRTGKSLGEDNPSTERSLDP